MVEAVTTLASPLRLLAELDVSADAELGQRLRAWVLALWPGEPPLLDSPSVVWPTGSSAPV